MAPAPDSLHDGGTVAVWFVKPNLIFTRVRSPHYSVMQAETFVGAIWSRARAALEAERYVWVSDSRAILSYDTASRLLLTRWVLDHRDDLERVVLLVTSEHRLVMAGIRVGCLAGATMGIPVFVESSPSALLERHGIRFPGGL